MRLIDNRFKAHIDIEVGDVIVCEYGELFIIFHDDFDQDYPYALTSLTQMRIIEKHSTVENCIQEQDGISYIDGLKIIDVINYDDVTLTAGVQND